MKNKGIKLFVFDFDGTALGGHEPYDQFPRPFAKFLDELDAKGIRWATNTTWAPDPIYAVARRSGVRSEPVFLTGQTSRLLATVKNGEVVHDEEYEKSILRRERRFKRKNWPQVRRIFMKLLRADLVDRICFDFFGQNSVTFSCKKKDSRRVWRMIAPLLESGEYYSFSGTLGGTSGTLLSRHMNKGEIMKVLLRRLKLKPENVIVAGDGTNDLHMFDPRFAKWMVCPANASPLIKERVRQFGGVVGRKKFSWGIIEGVRKILFD